MLSENDVLISTEDEKEYHVLWTDRSRDIAYTLECGKNSCFPVKMKLSYLEEQLTVGILKITQIEMSKTHVSEEMILERDRKLRDSAWNVISDIVAVEPDIYSLKKQLTYHELEYVKSVVLQRSENPYGY